MEKFNLDRISKQENELSLPEDNSNFYEKNGIFLELEEFLIDSSDFVDVSDKEIIYEIYNFVSRDEDWFWDEESAVNYLESSYNSLTSNGKIFLVNQSINYISSNSFWPEASDVRTAFYAILKLSRESSSNFFVEHFAKSFDEEDDFKKMLDEDPVNYLRSIWDKYFRDIDEDGFGKVTKFETRLDEIIFDRQINSPNDLENFEIKEISDKLFSEHNFSNIDYNPINSYVWTSKNKIDNSEGDRFSYSKTATLQLSKDLNAQYDTKTGNVIEYLPKDSSYVIGDKNIGLSNTDFNPSSYLGDVYENIDNLVYLHKIFASKRLRQHMEKYFGFRYDELNFKTQIAFINFVFDKSNKEVDKVHDFISSTLDHKTRVNRFRTFLSLERSDESLGDKIVDFGQHEEMADKVFSYYGELLDSADQAETLVRENTHCDNDNCKELIEQVRENILNRAQKDLEKAVLTNDPAEIEILISNYLVSAKEYVALLQEVGINKIEKISTSELSDNDKEQMEELLRKNYEIISPGNDQAEFRNAVLASLQNSFNKENTEFRILRDKDKIVSFNRFDTIVDDKGNEMTYFGSFNADAAYSGVGGVVLEETLKDRLKDGRPMLAHTDPSQPITKKYVNSGFVVMGIEENYSGTGRTIFEIQQSREINNQLKSKQFSSEELLSMVDDSRSDLIVREQTELETYPEIYEGKALTRYISHNGKNYLVFEKLPKLTSVESKSVTDDYREVT